MVDDTIDESETFTWTPRIEHEGVSREELENALKDDDDEGLEGVIVWDMEDW